MPQPPIPLEPVSDELAAHARQVADAQRDLTEARRALENVRVRLFDAQQAYEQTRRNLEKRGPGRPEIGNPVHVRLGDLRDAVNGYAAAYDVSVAEAIRDLIREGLARRGLSDSAPDINSLLDV
jgi:hypothetical protein